MVAIIFYFILESKCFKFSLSQLTWKIWNFPLNSSSLLKCMYYTSLNVLITLGKVAISLSFSLFFLSLYSYLLFENAAYVLSIHFIKTNECKQNSILCFNQIFIFMRLSKLLYPCTCRFYYISGTSYNKLLFSISKILFSVISVEYYNAHLG